MFILVPAALIRLRNFIQSRQVRKVVRVAALLLLVRIRRQRDIRIPHMMLLDDDEPVAASRSILRADARSWVCLAAGVRRLLASQALFSWASAEGWAERESVGRDPDGVG
jgi:hypothetical protein